MLIDQPLSLVAASCYRARNMSYWLTKLGSVMAGVGVVWMIYTATQNANLGVDAAESAAGSVIRSRGPMELSGAGVLVWLVGKYLRSTSKHM